MITRTERAVDVTTSEKQAIVDAIQRRVVDDASGASEAPFERYHRQDPSSRFWLGLLACEPGVQADTDRPVGGDRLVEASERFRPAAQGFSFRVPHLPIDLELNIAFAVWAALHPELAEQRDRNLRDEEADAAGAEGDQRVDLVKVRMKIPVGPVTLSVRVDEQDTDHSEPRHVGRQDISSAVRAVLRSLPLDTVLHRPLRAPGGTRPFESDLRHEGTWTSWEQENLTDPAHPDWVAEVDLDVTATDGGFEILVTLVNRSPESDHQYSDRDKTRNFVTWACDTNIYEARVAATPLSEVIPYELEQIPDSFRYDRTVRALGWNSAVAENGPAFETRFAAVAGTERIYPRTRETDPSTQIDVRFDSLIKDPIPALEELVTAAESWVESAWSDSVLNEMASANGWGPETVAAARDDAEEARREVQWVMAGLEKLQGDPNSLRAFRLMNETMKRVAGDRFESWRPFQVAFILGCIPGLVEPGSDPYVDILWFPTGGGKTEAYLGLNAFYLFLSRLRGSTGGTYTWARFPLRLLSLQQTQRFADSVLHAEIVRREEGGPLAAGDPFGVGYLVGAGNTPNKVELPGSRFYEESGAWDPEENAESCRVLEECPGCGNRPEVRFERADHTMEHVCQTEACPLVGRLPVYVIDDDLHRRVPSVLVGTVDKMTQISTSNGFRHFLGRAYGLCPVHGLSKKQGACATYPCDHPLQPVPQALGGIGLEIQDEMHLLSETLGSLDGNYETLFHSIAAEFDLPQIKIIGATATIEGYREQSDHLYRREPRRFPLPGPQKSESFWAFENPDDPLRTYVAALPRGTTMLNASYHVTTSHRRLLEEALADTVRFCASIQLEPERADEVRGYLQDLYYILTTYALRRQELARYRRDITEDPDLFPEYSWAEITGDVDFWDVRQALSRLTNREPGNEVRVLGATSAISHGVDVDQLNVMCMMGMPNQVSEFIQATARVGRSHPGLVFCLVNPYRKRDVSHFRYFTKWAEYLDRLVERVPVNRESLPVLELVLPGGFMAWLLQVDEPAWMGGGSARNRRKRLWWAREVAQAIAGGVIDEPGTKDRLIRSFAIPRGDPRFALHETYIDRFVEKVLLDIQMAAGDRPTTEILAQADYPVPTSLRDVEKTIRIRGER